MPHHFKNVKLRRGLRLKAKAVCSQMTKYLETNAGDYGLEETLALANFGLAYNGEAWEHMTPIPCRRGSKRKIPAWSVSFVDEPS